MFSLIFFQRITQICKLLGKSDETIQRKLQGFLSMDSIDGYLASHLDDTSISNKLTSADRNSDDSDHKLNHIDSGLKYNDITQNHVKSDSESGFDESSSQMSRSGIEDGNYTMENSMLTRSPSSEQLSLDQLVAEMKTVALDWRPFRNVHNCSCATPFDHYMKKARNVS